MSSGPDAAPPPDAPAPQAPPKKGLPLSYVWWAAAAVLLVLATLFFAVDTTKKITWTEYVNLSADGNVKKLVIESKQRAWGEVRDPAADAVKELKLSGGKFAVTLPLANDQQTLIDQARKTDADHRARLRQADPQDATPEIQIDLNNEPPQYLAPVLWAALPLAAFLAVFVFFVLPRLRETGGGGLISGFTRSPAKRYDKGVSKRTTFDDVAGMETVKRELQEVVDFLRNADKFERLGAQVPKGVLLVGPPGTGKTLLAKAVAGEANVPFYSVNGSEFIQMFVGVGAGRVRDLFRTAKDSAPCVVFIDEIDAVGRMRGTGVGGGSDEREQTLNQILSEMDGFSPNETVIVLAATNRPDVLDAALLRPGRFDRHVTVGKPTWQGRLAILKVHTRNKPLDDAVDLQRIARQMIGMSGAELRNLCNEAALVATRGAKSRIEQADFDAAADRVRLGARRDEAVTEAERRRTAYHEAGHALCAYLEPKADPIERVSVIPRGQSGGVAMLLPDEDRLDESLSQLTARLVFMMGGRAADKLVFGEPLTGEIGDLRQATRIARAMVTQFGMSERLGPVHYRAGEDHVFLGKEIVESREFSEGTARIIDEEVQRILTDAEARATHLLAMNRSDLDRLAGALIVHEELDREAVHRLLRKSPADPVPPAPTAVSVEPDLAPAPPALAFGAT